jgi:hypothetical protein
MLKEVMEVYDLLDNPTIRGEEVSCFLGNCGAEHVVTRRVGDGASSTDIVKVVIPGLQGISCRGKSPSLGVIGTLAGLGARPAVKGIVSDADGAIAAIAVALRLVQMQKRGESLDGDVIITTHVCPSAPTEPHEPFPFVGYPVAVQDLMKHLVDPAAGAILSIDTTKGNRVINYKGFCISPTVKEGYILRVSEDLLDIMQITTGRLPVVLPITTQDITPYENGLYHLNTIMQPSTVTKAPVVGVAITTESGVPGCATGASHLLDISMAAQFVIEVAKSYTEAKCTFYSETEFHQIVKKYGKMNHLQKQ